MTGKLPLVSVLIPCYNAERWIGETLRSVLAQNWPNIEIIVVDDGSTDDSAEAVRTVNDSRIHLVTQANRGQTAAFNRCLDLAKGDYLQYLDADDLLAPDKIEVQMRRLADRPGCIATACWSRFRNDPKEAVFVEDPTWCDLDPVDWLVANWREGGGMMYPAMWLMPRSLADRIGPWCESLSLVNDTEYFTRAVLASDKVLFCRNALTYYRSGITGSLSGRKSDEGWCSYARVLSECERMLLERERSDRTLRVSAFLWQRLAYAAYPYHVDVALRAEARARALHHDVLPREGGKVFLTLSRFLGWKTTRWLQVKMGRQ